MLISW